MIISEAENANFDYLRPEAEKLNIRVFIHTSTRQIFCDKIRLSGLAILTSESDVYRHLD